jgi:hypothetical protein
MDDHGSGLRLYVWAMGLLAAVAGAWLFMVWGDLSDLERIASDDRRSAQTELADLAARVESLASETIDPEREAQSGDKTNFQQWLEKCAREATIPAGGVTIFQRREDKNTRGRFTEISYNVKIDHASRLQIADFCYRLEYYRDYLKVRYIKLAREAKTTGEDWKNTIIRVAYREPLQG